MTDSDTTETPWYDKVKPPKERTEIHELPQWYKVAQVYSTVLGETEKAAAKRFNRKQDTFRGYRKSPAGKKWRAQLLELADDPVAMAKAVLGESATAVTAGYLIALQQAAAAGDYAEVGRMSRDLMDRVDLVGDHKTKQTAQIGNITLQLPANYGQALEVESAAIEMIPAEIEDE